MIITAAIQFAVLAIALAGLYLSGKEQRAARSRQSITCQVKIFRPDETSDAIPTRRAA